jgi:regulator of protease activity HflC (stomatin/prohibitin superfamily)
MSRTTSPQIPMKLLGAGFLALVSIILVVFFWGHITETNKAGYVQVKQAAISGKLSCRMEPGLYGQWFGDIHTYPIAGTYDFNDETQGDTAKDQRLPTRFSDGTPADVSGSVRVVMPTVCEELLSLHNEYKSFNGVMDRLVDKVVRKAIFSTGSHMTAAQSYAERRPEVQTIAEEQVAFGVFQVEETSETTVDELTGQETTIKMVKKISCDTVDDTCLNGYFRQESPFMRHGITATNFVIDGIQYKGNVLAQIEAQRKARMDVITEQAEAGKAKARAERAEAEAEAAIAETRATEEVSKTQLIVRAEAKKEQADLDAEAAAAEKQANILRGQGEAERKRLVMQADGALEKKLDAYIETQKVWAEAYKTRSVPQVVMGGSNGDTDSSTQDFIDLMTMQTAKDLSLNMSTK